MKKQPTSIRTIYESQLKNKSPFYEMFDYIIKNYNQFKSLKYLHNNQIDDNLLRQRLSELDKHLCEFKYDMIEFVDCGEIHLSYLTDKCDSIKTIIKVFSLLVKNKTVREVTNELRISAHTVHMCRFIAANALASMYIEYNKLVA